LRATKNRFGTTDGVCVFAMADGGLREVGNPSSLFLGERPSGAPGSTVVATLQGARPLLVEVQALVSSAGYGTPRRLVSGLDYNRACMIVAVLERRLGMQLGTHDVYMSVVGGLKVSEPAADLGIAVAIASALRNRPVADDLVCFGEIGLAGELRAVSGAERRLDESAKLGFRIAIMPNRPRDHAPTSALECKSARTLADAIALALD
jgi:DNA repair protein RadA/Sms